MITWQELLLIAFGVFVIALAMGFGAVLGLLGGYSLVEKIFSKRKGF